MKQLDYIDNLVVFLIIITFIYLFIGSNFTVVQLVHGTTVLKLEGGTCNVPARKLNLVLKSRILRKFYLNLFSIKYQYKPKSPNRNERSSGILMGQIVSLYRLGKERQNLLPVNSGPNPFEERYKILV